MYVAECIALILEYPYITFTRQYLTQVSRLFVIIYPTVHTSWHVGTGGGSGDGISMPFSTSRD